MDCLTFHEKGLGEICAIFASSGGYLMDCDFRDLELVKYNRRTFPYSAELEVARRSGPNR